MIRNAFRAVPILLAALVIPAAILTSALPASAAANNLCETYDPTTYCLGSANLDLYTPVTERNPGRNLVETPLGGTYDNAPTYLLQFSADPTKCVGVKNDIVGVEIKPCNGGTGIVWARVKDATNVYRWINRYASENNIQGQILYLSGFGNGGTYQVLPFPSTGWYQRFSWVNL